MVEKSNGKMPGFWKRNWLLLAVISLLSWVGMCYWKVILEISPYLVIVHSFLLYLFVVKLLYDNRFPLNNLFMEMRDGGWLLIKVVARPGMVFWQKCGVGMDLLTQRLGVEQELIIAEKRKKKLEIELSQKELHVQLAQLPELSPTPAALGAAEEGRLADEEKGEEEEKGRIRITEPLYARYEPILMEYLEQVRWERFTIKQAQLILHKRFGTVKLVLEELVGKQKLEHVRVGKRIAYRPVDYGK
ncbi:MAG: hypothetical protein LUH50_26175 [Bacteroides intestinalis]|nr:hypothetical protein [Bacteroides intestinalis]